MSASGPSGPLVYVCGFIAFPYESDAATNEEERDFLIFRRFWGKNMIGFTPGVFLIGFTQSIIVPVTSLRN